MIFTVKLTFNSNGTLVTLLLSYRNILRRGILSDKFSPHCKHMTYYSNKICSVSLSRVIARCERKRAATASSSTNDQWARPACSLVSSSKTKPCQFSSVTSFCTRFTVFCRCRGISSMNPRDDARVDRTSCKLLLHSTTTTTTTTTTTLCGSDFQSLPDPWHEMQRLKPRPRQL